MTSAIEFSYLDDSFAIKINETIMNRAVRVKVSVKDKIGRLFNSNVTNDNVQVNTGVVSSNSDSLLDLGEETLKNLNDKLNALQLQEKVPYVVNRAVLFTQALVLKYRSARDRWFAEMPVINKPVDGITSVDAINHLGGEVVPGTWDTVLENSNDASNVAVDVPSFENEPEQNVEIVSKEEIPSVDTNDDATFNFEADIPSFMPNMDQFIPEEPELNAQNSDLIPEPKQVEEISESEYVPEPSEIGNMSTLEETRESELSMESNVYEPVSEPVELESSNQTVNSEMVSDKENMSIEQKIASLIQQKRFVQQREPEAVGDIKVNEENSVEVRENVKPELTQSGVIARLQKYNNIMKDKDDSIRRLTAKNETLKVENGQMREKIDGYEETVSELTATNNNLLAENEKLSARVTELENSSQATISRLEEQVATLNETKAEEVENSKNVLAEMKAKYEAEIASLKVSHAEELSRVTASKDKQIQTIYATISEALGDFNDEDYNKSKAA